jgi:uncharacterized protein
MINALQTNGTLIDQEWGRFLKKHNFLVGLSLDGPRALHNSHRKYTSGKATFCEVEKTIKLLQANKVDFNILTTVNDVNAREPLKLYDYYKQTGIQFIQFIPIVERSQKEHSNITNQDLASPEDSHKDTYVTSWSVNPDRYADFLITIFDQWVKQDIGKIFIMNFEWTLSAAIYGVSGTCHFAEKCGSAGIVEHNGDVYSCDHFVYPSNKIGNILEDEPSYLFSSPKQEAFGKEKQLGLSNQCSKCEVLHLCYGGCPKHRIVDGQNYLCKAYKRFFSHIMPYAKAAERLISQGEPLTELMRMKDIQGI